MHRASSVSYLTCWVPHDSPRAPLTFLFPNQFPILKTLKETQETNKKKIMETHNNNTAPQQSGIVMHQTHTNRKSSASIVKYQKHKTNNRHHHSIPMVPSSSKGKLNLRLLQDSWKSLLPCNSLHYTTINT